MNDQSNMNLSICDIADEDREAFIVFERFSNGGIITVQGLENMADDMDLDFELLKALVDGDGNCQIEFEGVFCYRYDSLICS